MSLFKVVQNFANFSLLCFVFLFHFIRIPFDVCICVVVLKAFPHRWVNGQEDLQIEKVLKYFIGEERLCDFFGQVLFVDYGPGGKHKAFTYVIVADGPCVHISVDPWRSSSVPNGNDKDPESHHTEHQTERVAFELHSVVANLRINHHADGHYRAHPVHCLDDPPAHHLSSRQETRVLGIPLPRERNDDQER